VKHHLPLLALGFAVVCPAAVAQEIRPIPAPVDRVETVARLLDVLRRTDNPTTEFERAGPPYTPSSYRVIKDSVTQQVLSEVDIFVTDLLLPGSMPVAQMKSWLDQLLNHAPHSLEAASVFPVTLPSGRYLVIGVDVPRIGPPPEDALSLRAYKESAGQFRLVADAELVRAEGGVTQTMSSLHVAALRSQPVSGEFWFLAWARVNSAEGFAISLRLYRFDGTQFRTVATTGNVRVKSDQAVRTTPQGFSVATVDESQSAVIEEYAVTANGPVRLDDKR
jgi:hypothetical protein